MNILRRQTILLALSLAAVLGLSLSASAAELSAADKHFLAAYEQVRIALTSDDLVNAKALAADLEKDGVPLENCKTLAEAREAFSVVSQKAVRLAKGQSGYYIAYCPMLKKEWVQTSTQISNPFAGEEMRTCGEIRK